MIIPLIQINAFLLVLARIIGLMVDAPFLGNRAFPVLAKITLAAWLAMVLWFVAPINPGNLPVSMLSFVIMLISEFGIGFLLGFVGNIIFNAFQAGGEILDMQMGLSVAQSFDPLFGGQISVVGRLFLYLGVIVFVTVNGHHLFLTMLYQSFTLLPSPHLANFASPVLAQQFMSLGSKFYYIAIMTAAPGVLTIFLLSDFVFGIVSRVAPQVNVFMLSFQVRPILGMITVLLTLSLLVTHMANMLEPLAEELMRVLMAIR